MSLRGAAVAAGTVACLLLSGCGGDSDDGEGSGDETVAGSNTASGSTSSDDPLETYFSAVAHRDPDQLQDALTVARPGSIAYDYAGYVMAIANAGIAGGEPPNAGELSEAGDGYQGCEQIDGQESCVTWSDFQVVDDQLVDFTIDGQSLDDRLSAGNGRSVPSGTLGSATLLYAYQSVQSGALYVIAEVSANDAPISIGSDEATYRDETGRELTAVHVLGPTALDAGSSATLALIFGGGTTGGVASLTLRGADSGTEEDLRIQTPRCHDDPAGRTCTQEAA